MFAPTPSYPHSGDQLTSADMIVWTESCQTDTFYGKVGNSGGTEQTERPTQTLLKADLYRD